MAHLETLAEDELPVCDAKKRREQALFAPFSTVTD
jgi:hypothetical protein